MTISDEVLKAISMGWRPKMKSSSFIRTLLCEMPDTDECVEIGFELPGGYRGITISGTLMVRAHRVAAAAYIGDITDYHSVDHTCFNRACCNPKHLRLAKTQRDNVKRGSGEFAQVHRSRKDILKSVVQAYIKENQ